jgi:glutamate N-acetyltransferase/amino-acid N-acetyltransferase
MSVTAPLGFRAAGVAAGIKENGGRDLALVINEGPSRAAAGVFTRNRVKAAPVLWSEQVLAGGRLRAVVLNSGGANACTGPAGFQDTHATAEKVAEVLGDSAGEVAVCSTGLIGERLPLEKILDGIDAAAGELSRGDGGLAADAIRTTDTVAKIAFRRSDEGGARNNGRSTSSSGGDAGGGAARVPSYMVGGMAKGAGMLAPALATMLCVITTDADVDAATLDRVLRAATAVTFERLDADGCLSTNDTVLLLASGAAGVTPTEAELTETVTDVCADLTRQLLVDAEGAAKAIAIEVVGAANVTDAVAVGRAVARNNLLKCAIHGEDPNWGRVLAAIGTTDAAFEPARLNVAINGVWVCRGGSVGDDRSKVDLRPRDVTITIDLSAGPHSATVWTTDLTADYVHENSAYST